VARASEARAAATAATTGAEALRGSLIAAPANHPVVTASLTNQHHAALANVVSVAGHHIGVPPLQRCPATSKIADAGMPPP